MDIACDFNITIVGLGLIGGSMAKAIRENLKVKKIWAVDLDRDVLNEAHESGIIDDLFEDDKIPLKDSDIVILCTYPGAVLEFMKNNRDNFKPGALITDTSGIKEKIVEGARDVLRSDCEFIGGHPMSGKESMGYKYSDGNIFQGTNYIITPDEKSNKEMVLLLKEILFTIGFKKIIEMSPREHDRIVAYTSQLPHILACIMMNSKSFELSRDLRGGSFRDITRVADINCDLWSELLHENKQNILAELDALIQDVKNISKMIDNDDIDSLKSVFKNSSMLRKEMNYERA
jgi:prephenate dehydrogenase